MIWTSRLDQNHLITWKLNFVSLIRSGWIQLRSGLNHAFLCHAWCSFVLLQSRVKLDNWCCNETKLPFVSTLQHYNTTTLGLQPSLCWNVKPSRLPLLTMLADREGGEITVPVSAVTPRKLAPVSPVPVVVHSLAVQNISHVYRLSGCPLPHMCPSVAASLDHAIKI